MKGEAGTKANVDMRGKKKRKAATLVHNVSQILILGACEASGTFGLELLESPLWCKLAHL